jgi:hypothetical protein
MVDQNGNTQCCGLKPRPQYTHVIRKVSTGHSRYQQDQGSIINALVGYADRMSFVMEVAVIKSGN